MTSAGSIPVLFTHERPGSAEDRLAALSEMGELTTTLQRCLSYLVTNTGPKMQIIGTEVEGWFNLNLVLSTEMPVDVLRQNSPKTNSIPENKKDVASALTCILLLKMLLKKVEIQTTDGSVDPLLVEVNRISSQLIGMRAATETNFLSLYRSLVESAIELKEALSLKKWASKSRANQISEDELFMEVLGFGGLVEIFQTLDTYDRNHQDVTYYIEKCANSTSPSPTKGFVGDSKLESSLLTRLGVSPDMLGIFRDMIATDKTQLVPYWVLKHANQMISSHVLLSVHSCFGYNPHLRDVWLGVTVDRRKGCRIGRQSKEIDMRHVSENAQFDDRDIIGHCAPKTKLWYHGTDTFDAAYSIINEGIILHRGAKNQDFSDIRGFYLTDSFEAAKKYARRCGTNGYAILVFEDNVDPARWKVLDLEGRDETWKRVIRHFRFEIDKRDEDELTVSIQDEVIKVDDLDCIKGSICSNIKQMLDGSHTDMPMYTLDGRKVQQMCVKTYALANHFGSLDNIRAVLWYSG